MPESLRLVDARRIALAAQLRPKATRFKTVLERLGCIQLDTISAVRRAHELTLLARNLDVAEAVRSLDRRPRPVAFEYWAHAMSLLPVSAWPYLARRRKAWRERYSDDSLAVAEAEVLALLADRGAITVSDFPSGAMHRNQGTGNMGDSWNFRTDHKQAVERLLWFGEVACTHRIGFKRVYQLAERAIPAEHLWDADDEACLRYMVTTALRNLGVGTSKDIADYFRLKIADAERVLRELEIEQVAVEGWKGRTWIDPQVRRSRVTGAERAVPVSMFDQLVWLRERMERLWGHGWKIEIYVPEPLRTFGYYCLPIFVGDDLPGRVALRRSNGDLVVEAAQWDDARADREHLHAAVERAASWVGAEVRWKAEVEGPTEDPV
ncbi:winged helix DNA-binding domain-containing protein [Glycomyces sp. TRM65418]|uniref:DNA glycosylase AlkZ-like family protein n=1 Tax=Glycomyces sp. TRM65418 TaxID=2867006 RepID=UPI001CE60C2F|nr:crosslink repair DNA glycosylase YcaQ family protein [Glycomyces sp. TRM65418]MCC3765650.1 winged helix DNA-binding domain-containing protein [Glycomyces sp. TRM65418]QZD55248.1 winged helix DNA-binding domain-containing protein [Glycomyces sp. TRM65418]